MKLELKHLAPYLPYGLRIFNKDNKSSYVLSTGSIDRVTELPEIFKPILRPLSDLTERASKVMSGLSLNTFIKKINNQDLSYITFNELISLHFDVFGLIEEGLAIDINTLSNEN